MSEKKNPNTVFVQVVERPARKMILKRGIKATHYFEFCEEVGCDIWGILCNIKDAIYEPVGCWMPDRLTPPRERRSISRASKSRSIIRERSPRASRSSIWSRVR